MDPRHRFVWSENPAFIIHGKDLGYMYMVVCFVYTRLFIHTSRSALAQN